MADFTREEIEEKLAEYAELIAAREEEDEFVDEPDEESEVPEEEDTQETSEGEEPEEELEEKASEDSDIPVKVGLVLNPFYVQFKEFYEFQQP